ncbi:MULTISPECIES: hypothetical protein [unclassified Paracoccus (in: a-proteobacteria)]|uniref:hypothetical protein n=1 Tax=unclassified Paracoccus (in: a-proteobacteria) TaxID=2688777 RepID=UPI001F28CF56|nr:MULTISPECIES: hypothetical protein [unclassified Paracoccus (in: a-proteobacteria)]
MTSIPGTAVVSPPPGGTVVVTPPPAVPNNAAARQVINAEMARRLPGRNVGPLTDCVVANATMAELADIAAQQGQAGAAGAVASVVSRPATSQCISRAAVA